MSGDLRAILRWYADMGVDIAVDVAPHDRIGEEAARRAREPAATDAPPLAAAMSTARIDRNAALAGPGGRLERDAFDAAASARSLDELRKQLLRFEGCGLKATATQLVFGCGDAGAEIMFVGEAPGADEDRRGAPFVGRAGQLLDRMMAAIGLDRSKVYIANVVPWRPPGNRTPTPQESQICLPFILRQIELVDPDILVCLGGPSAQTLLGIKEGITKTRGRWFTFNTGKREIRAMATFHPAFLLRSPLQKRFAWRDFLAIKKALAG